MKIRSIDFEISHVNIGKHKGEYRVLWLRYFLGFGRGIQRFYFEDSFTAIRHVQRNLSEAMVWMR